MKNTKKITLVTSGNFTPSQNERIIYLPFQVRLYRVPQTKPIDILQQLVLSIAELNSEDDFGLSTTPFDKLKKIGFPKDLVDCVAQVMIDNNIVDSSGKPNKQKINQAAEDDISKSAVVYVFKDASQVGNGIIPDFSIENYQSKNLKNEQEENFFLVETTKNSSSKLETSPVELMHAIKIFIKNSQSQDSEILVDENNETFDEAEFEDDETSWQVENNLPTINADIYQKNSYSLHELKNIEPYNDQSNLIYFEASIYFDVDSPDRIYMKAPSIFSNKLDSWFDKLFLRLQQNDKNLKKFVDNFFDRAMDEAKKNYAFNNELNIELFNQYPIISNDEKYANLKKEIENMKRAENRILFKNEMDYDTFYMRCNCVLECIIKIVVKRLSVAEKKNISANIHRSDFRYQVQELIKEFDLKDAENYQSISADAVNSVLKGKNTLVKAGMIVLLFNAYFNQRESLAILYNVEPLILKKAAYLVDVRNKFAGHHNANQKDSNADLNRKIFDEVRETADEVITLLVSHCLIRSDIYGEEK